MRKIVIIGAGILGCSLARELASKKAGTILVLEKEPEEGLHASSRNSGVIHSGINQKPGTLKAKFCVEGSRLLREYCRQRGVPMRECGTLVVAKSSEEELCLKRLYDMGQACGVPGLEILDVRKIKEREPMAQGASGLFSPTGAVVDAKVLVETIKREAEELGVKFYFHQQVKKIECQKIFTYNRVFQPDHIINCAGVFADRIAHMMGCGQGLHIVPFLGSYYEVTNIDVRGMIYQTPDLRFPFLSTHLTRKTDGRVIAGPTAILTPGRESYNGRIQWKDSFEMLGSISFYKMIFGKEFLKMGWKFFKQILSKKSFAREIQALVGPFRHDQLKPYPPGIRAQLVGPKGNLVQDFVVEYRETSTHILNCVSPGLTSSLAFAAHVTKQIRNGGGL